jgi:hypothetical protein
MNAIPSVDVRAARLAQVLLKRRALRCEGEKGIGKNRLIELPLRIVPLPRGAVERFADVLIGFARSCSWTGVTVFATLNFQMQFSADIADLNRDVIFTRASRSLSVP